jgi:hypothetical protein
VENDRRPSFQGAPEPREASGQVVGVCAFSGSLRGLKLVPVKWRYLVPPTSGYPAESVRGRPQAVGQPIYHERNNFIREDHID